LTPQLNQTTQNTHKHSALPSAAPQDIQTARQLAREEAEASLTLAGLLVVDCPVKKDTAGVIAELQVGGFVRFFC
jgi:magnesium-transporting ATPase (P-type)